MNKVYSRRQTKIKQPRFSQFLELSQFKVYQAGSILKFCTNFYCLLLKGIEKKCATYNLGNTNFLLVFTLYLKISLKLSGRHSVAELQNVLLNITGI